MTLDAAAPTGPKPVVIHLYRLGPSGVPQYDLVTAWIDAEGRIALKWTFGVKPDGDVWFGRLDWTWSPPVVGLVSHPEACP